VRYQAAPHPGWRRLAVGWWTFIVPGAFDAPEAMAARAHDIALLDLVEDRVASSCVDEPGDVPDLAAPDMVEVHSGRREAPAAISARAVFGRHDEGSELTTATLTTELQLLSMPFPVGLDGVPRTPGGALAGLAEGLPPCVGPVPPAEQVHVEVLLTRGASAACWYVVRFHVMNVRSARDTKRDLHRSRRRS
jgi:hypothetical protein